MALKEVLLGPIYIARALATTFKHNAKPIVTIEYPERQKAVPPRERGKHILHRYADGLEKCVGCELCAIACPVGCIVVEAAENTPEHRVSPGERYAKRYEINLLRCIYCGMCEEACPYDAITMGPRYDLADDHPDKFIAVKEDMLEPLSASVSDTARPSGAPSAQPVPRKW
jgi:NADH-quinone oxidoreductase subunit I